VACDACRTRKSRCDGNRPLCSLCRDLGFECIYTPPTTATNVIVQKDYLHGLEDRVRKLEDSLSTVKDDIAGLITKVDQGPGQVLQPSEYEGSQRVVAGHVPDLTGTEDSVDAMGAVTFANEEDSGFFAMATITAIPDGSSADTRIAESDVFYQRGLGLCGSEILRGATLEVGQCFSDGCLSILTSENHRTLSMTFGRPAAIPDSYVKLDLPLKREFEKPSDFVDDETSVLSVAFFNATITLYKHLWNVLDLLYGQNLGCDPSLPITEAAAHIFSMEQHLFAWERSLTQPLQLISIISLDEMAKGQLSNYQYFSWKFRVILTLRYLNLRVLLHRPVLVKFIAASANTECDPQDLKLLQQIGMNSMQICADSAMAIIDIVHQVVTEPGWKQSLLGAWWFSLYYTFNAALVIIGTVWVYRDTSVTGTPMTAQASKAKQYPCRAVAALSKLDEGNRLIDRCRYYLEQCNKALNDPETHHDVATPSFHGLTGNRIVSANDLTFSPFGMELGEFMMDGDLVGMMDRQEILPVPGTSYPA
ncbi:hypothetical protein N7510_007013, partial [Penicillium lagena]|uniref:uncharacterized protein n=1 Tax=Penicillium lagena TaxID=94218 RepID=UPI00253F7FA8